MGIASVETYSMSSTKLSWRSPIQHDVELLDHYAPEEPLDSDWPAQGQPLRKQKLQLIVATISDLVMMLLWIAMLGFAGLIARCNGLSVKDLPYHYDHLTQASTIVSRRITHLSRANRTLGHNSSPYCVRCDNRPIFETAFTISS